ncbi:MAG: secretion system protein F [Lentisphaerae bacterium]|nr:secretion system protein F [Lentisphaerota bacterium]
MEWMSITAIALLAGFCVGLLIHLILRNVYASAETYSGTYSEHVARQFEEIFQFVPARQIAQAGWALAGIAFAFVFFLTGSLTSLRGITVGLMFGIIAGFGALHLPHLVLRILKKRRLQKFNEQLVDTLVTMSNALKAGFSITQSFEIVVRDGEVPISQEFSVFVQETRIGVGFDEALRNMERRVGSDDLSLVVMAIETARKTGGNLTEVFERIAHTIRERMRIEVRIRTLTAQGRLQGFVVGSMPVIIGVVLMIVDPDLMMPFLYSGVGIAVIAAVVLLVASGGMIIRKIVNIDV